MNNSIRFLLLLLLIALLAPVSSPGQEFQDLEKKVKRYVGWMTKKNGPDVWEAALRLESLGKKAVPLIKAKIITLPEMAQVACAKALIIMEDRDYAIELLLRVLKDGKDRQAQIKATNLLGIHGDYELEDALNAILDNTFDPYLKIAVAKTLWQVARTPQATKVLKYFLESNNVDLKYTAAIALGEIGNVAAAKPTLSHLKDEPSFRGRLARSLLEQETRVNYYERLLSTRMAGKPASPAAASKYKLIDEVIDKIEKYHIKGDKFTRQELITAAVKGMVAQTDIHSVFWTDEEWNEFVKETINEEYVGIGVFVSIRDGYFTVIAPIYSGPAYRAGIRSMDRIMAVDGWPTRNKASDDIVKRIRGSKGSSVKLKIFRPGWSKMREFTVTRESIKIPNLFSQRLPGAIGYLRLTQFGRKAAVGIEKALRQFEATGIKAVILDLRANAGGWLKMAVDIADKFLPAGKLIVYSKGRHPVKGRESRYYSTKQGTHPQYPVVVLVDKATASASEIVAGALQCHKRAILIGQRTYGKGSVQEPMALNSRPGSRLKLTIAMYYLPDGRCIHNDMDSHGQVLKHNGIEPDIKVDYENWESWKNEELAKLEDKNVFKDYIAKYYDKNHKLFRGLADNDGGDPARYPDFANWYKALDTIAKPDDVRYWLRNKIRQKVADERGQQYACDYLEDEMLQRAIIELCRKLNIVPKTIPEYQVFAQKFNEKKKK